MHLLWCSQLGLCCAKLKFKDFSKDFEGIFEDQCKRVQVQSIKSVESVEQPQQLADDEPLGKTWWTTVAGQFLPKIPKIRS